MIMSMIRPETEMKDTGIEWIGNIPSSWVCCKQKYVISLINGRAFKDTEFEEDGKYRILRVGNFFSNPKWYSSNLELEDDKYCDNGDLLYAWSMSYGPYIWNGEKVIYHYHIWKAKLLNNLSKRFAYYYLIALSDSIKSDVHETTMSFITMKSMNNSYIAFPEDIFEQQAIADYLDETCSKIDEIIAEVKASIVEYKELRESAISNATTRGIKKKRCMKPSGVEWLPEIPSDWNVLSPKVVFAQRKDRAIKGERQLTASQKHGIMYQDDYMKEEGVRIVTVEKDFSILKHVEPDDFVISMRSFQGGLEYSYLRGCISSAYVMLIPNHKYVYSEYYKWFFKSDKYINALQSTSDLIRDGQALRYANFVKLKLFDIPIEEQKEIADYLNKEVPKIDSLIAEKESLINDLEAYKKSLIYEVVTGKRRVV